MARCLPISVLLLGLAVYVSCRSREALDDLVTSLPDLNNQTFRQFSGYLDGGDGRNLHYWLTESQQNPSEDPLVLWLNGGPGCSSVYGFLGEVGPYWYDEATQGFIDNPYGWNKIANVLFLESPAGVGFSYSDTGSVQTSDTRVADQNYNALVDFFALFPEYEGRDFFIAGESYGGIYVPTLSERVFDGDLPINFVGFAVGNGLSSYDLNDNSLLYYAYYHGLFDDGVANGLGVNCCPSELFDPSCDIVGSNSIQCQALAEIGFIAVYDSGLNVYSLYNDCLQSSKLEQLKAHSRNVFRKTHTPDRLRESIEKLDAEIQNRPKSDPPCMNSNGLTTYLNRADVRAALHISDQAEEWTLCSDPVGNAYIRDYDTMLPIYQKLLGPGTLRALVYNGDTDMACNFLGDQWFTASLNRTVLNRKSSWVYDDQIAGFITQYENLDFVTFRGSGHMVPQEQPAQMYHVYSSFITNQPLR